jgi:hypothetical protein
MVRMRHSKSVILALAFSLMATSIAAAAAFAIFQVNSSVFLINDSNVILSGSDATDRLINR